MDKKTNNWDNLVNQYLYDLTSGKAVRARREAMDLSYKDVEEVVGISKSSMLNYENDTIPIEKDVAAKLSTILGISVSTILYPLGEETTNKGL